MEEFKEYHPLTTLIYFVSVIGFSMFLMHPVCLGISLVCSILSSITITGAQKVGKSLFYMVPMVIIAALLNPLFNHQGVTILLYFPGGAPLTLESIYYGLSAAVMIVTVLFWFSCLNQVLTGDRIIFLFGKILPSFSLILTMVFRFVPRFSAQMKVVARGQKCLSRDGGGLIRSIKEGLSILSVMITWSLENAVETADSMRARGYGLSGRTTFSIFTFRKRDVGAILLSLLLSAVVLFGVVGGVIPIQYFPSFLVGGDSPFGIVVFLAYCILCAYPLLIEFWEVRKWKRIRSRI